MRHLSTCLAIGFLWVSIPCGTAAGGIATTLSLTSSPQPSVYYAGQAISYIANVVATGTPTGTVVFTVDGVGTTPYPVDASHNATIVLHPSAGSHSISANYTGDQNYAPSASNMLTQVINKAATSVDMASNPPQIAQPVVIRAAVSVTSPGEGPAGGAVTFVNATNPIGGCTGLSLQNGVAICSTSFAQQGSVNVTANYSGDANTFGSSATRPLTVGKCSAGAYLAADPSAPATGAPVTLGVLLLGAPGVPTPTGTVTLSDGATTLATVAVGADGKASLVVPSGSIAAFASGTHTISAVYNGDGNYGVSRAAPLTLVVSGKSATTVTMSSSTAVIGQPVKITATVSGGVTVSGSVDFTNSTAAISGCTAVAVQSGAAVCNTTFPQAGSVTIGASYSGDGTNAASKGSMPLTIGKGSALITFSAAPSSPVSGATVTLSVTMTGAPGLTTPTGTIAISDGSAALATLPVDPTGHASLAIPNASLSALSIGSHSISAVYSGDVSYLSAAAAPLVVAVGKGAAAVTLSATPAQIAQPVKITAAITVGGAAGASAAGTVDFSNGATVISGCKMVPLQNGSAICNTSFPQAGTVTISASYTGDGNNAPATASLPLTVGKCSPVVGLAATPAAPLYGTPVTFSVSIQGATGVGNPTGTVTLSDGTAPLGTLTLSSDGHATLVAPSGSVGTLGAGSHSINAVYNGDANYSSSIAPPMAVVVGKATTTVMLAAAPTSPKPGQSTTLTAAVSPAGGGTVGFTNGPNPISGCTAVVIQGGIATCVTSFPQAGTFTIAANYSGDPNTSPGTGSLPLTVAQAAKPVPAISLAATPQIPIYGATTTFNLSVAAASGGPIPTGTVAFADGLLALGTAPLNASGQASLGAPSATIPALAAGTHTIGAVYSGDSYYGGATATPLSITIGKANTTTSLIAPYGGPFTATVTVVLPGAGTPTGQVQFSSGATSIGTATLQLQGSSFIATLPRNTQSGSITATYLGDANFGLSTSAPVTVTGPKAQVTIGSNHNPSTLGQSVTFSVYVTNNSGPGMPTGSVQLLADGTSLGTASLSAGVASFSTATLAIGPHTMVANYAGDANYPAASANLSQVVNKGAATLALSSSLPASVFGQPILFTAQWGSGTAPTGQMQFADGPVSLGSAVIQAGTATLTVANFAVGTHSVTASWSGDGTWGAATSAPLVQLVGKAQTATALASSGSGSSAKLTATVAVVAPGAGMPTGSVKFVNAATSAVLATVPLSGLGAVTPFPAVTDPIVALYSGDPNFQNSTSDALSQLAATNSASYATVTMAADEIVTLFGSNLGAATTYATPPADSLGGTTVNITDSAGIARAAQIFYVSPAQASILMPAGVAPGPAILTVTNPAQGPVSTTIVIGPVAPGLFTANSTGQGVAAAQVIRAHADGSQDAPQNLAVFDSRQNQWVPSPIDFGGPTDTVYLLLYGTGIRHYAAMPTCTIGGKTIAVAYAGAQGSFAGLDQVNLLLPSSLRGAGTVNLVLTVDGTPANTVTLAIQ